ncbi:MAG: outer membrane lipoprotein carrier protein LolA [Treponema sp.]|nr:outer membrane lipoprotein carrier protein LolA [Treponema sp.]
MIKRGIPLFALIFLFTNLYGQEIVTAEAYMGMVSDRFTGVRDFEANLSIRSGNAEMAGRVSYLSPSFFRVDFTRPSGQVINFNGETLTIFIPDIRANLIQTISRRTSGNTGLSMLRRNYTPSFLTGPHPVPLDEGSRERVMKLRLTRRTVSEGFREIILSIDPDTRLIRRMEGRTIAETEVRFDFTGIRVNQGVPEIRFVYESQPSANTYYNFLFRDND